MFFGCKVLKQDVMLRADAEYLSELIHIVEDTQIENRCLSSCGLNQASEDAYGCGLPSTIMSKQSEYLAIIYVDI